MQSLRKPAIETQNFRCLQRFQKEERKPGWKKEEEAGKGGKRGGLTDVCCHLQIPRHYGTFPWASRKGRTGTRPYQKPDQKIWVLCQEEVISLQSSAQAEALRPDSCIQDRGTRKMGRIERAKERKERGEGRGQVCLLFLTSRGTLASCPRQEETRDKRVPVAATGSGPLAGKLAPEYPEWSGCQSQRRRVPPESPFVAGRGTPSRAQNWSLV